MKRHVRSSLRKPSAAGALLVSLVLSACSATTEPEPIPGPAGMQPAVDDIVNRMAVGDAITFENLRTTDAKVTGTLVNQTTSTLRDVQLLVRHTWLWKNERNPGKNNPGRTEYFQVLEDLPPNGSVDFEYRPDPPLPKRQDGRFETRVEIFSFTEVR